MSYAKLFGSILDSTIWEQADHVRLVWITMMAMKDADGVVEASVPGLARRARVTIEQVEESLAILMSPDPYSRTPDFEGRRIAKADGGWVVLNHDKYREKDNAEGKRDKKAARQARWRDKKRLHETPVDASRPDKTHVSVSTSVSGSEYSRSGSTAGVTASSERPRDLVQASPVPDIGEARARDERASRMTVLRSMSAYFVLAVNEARDRVRRDLGIKTVTHPVPLMNDRERDLLHRLDAVTAGEVDPDRVRDLARQVIDHVVAIAELDARKKNGELRWLSWSLATQGSWDAKAQATRDEAAPAPPERAPLAAGRVEPKAADQMDQRKPWEIPAAEIEAERARVAASRSRK